MNGRNPRAMETYLRTLLRIESQARRAFEAARGEMSVARSRMEALSERLAERGRDVRRCLLAGHRRQQQTYRRTLEQVGREFRREQLHLIELHRAFRARRDELDEAIRRRKAIESLLAARRRVLARREDLRRENRAGQQYESYRRHAADTARQEMRR